MVRILVVEDSATMRSFVRAALECDPLLEWVEVVEASNGFDALRLLPRGSYDCVITDINMPTINGLELIRFIRQNERYCTIPLILISTQSSELDQQRGLSLGANAYLVKPFEPTQLSNLVRAHLKQRSPSTQPSNIF